MSTILDFPVKPETRAYLDAFGSGAAAPEPGWLVQLRRRGIDRFGELGFPTRRDENWRYFDLRSLAEKPRLPAVPHATDEGAEAQFADLDLDRSAYRLVFVDACFSPVFTGENRLLEGAWLGPISAALIERPELVHRALADDEDDAFAALNAAFFTDGFVLDLGPGIVLDRPVEIVHLATGSAEGSLHTRSLIRLAADSRASVIETFAGPAAGAYWRNDIVDISLGEAAALDRHLVVEEAADAVHSGLTRAVLGSAAHLVSFALLLGGGRVRQEMRADLAGEGARCRLDGAFIVGGRDEANIVATVDHRAPGGQTRELVKGVAAGRGHGAFQGRITVREGAQRTDAQQTTRNLIIGRRAVIDTKPELDIYADDVKCAHGATVGDLDEAALFYLRARGIPEDEARRLLIEGFLREAVERVAEPALRERLLRRLARRLAALEA